MPFMDFALREKCQNTVTSGLYFPVFGLNTEKYSVNLRIQSEYKKIQTKNNSVFGHFSRSVALPKSETKFRMPLFFKISIETFNCVCKIESS